MGSARPLRRVLGWGAMDIRVFDYVVGVAAFLCSWILHTSSSNHSRLRVEHDALRDAHHETRLAIARLEAQSSHMRETLQEVVSTLRRIEDRV